LAFLFHSKLWMESSSNIVQWFCQYEQKEQPPLTSNNWIQKRSQHMGL
jgi:hypothetical protein